MVEVDARKLGIQKVEVRPRGNAWRMVKERGFHFTSLVAVVVFMVFGFSAITAVFWATIAAAALSFLRRETALSFIPMAGTPLHRTRMVQALRAGSVGVLAVAATCAAAGIIVGVVTLTGLGLKFSSIVIDLAGGNLLATAACTALVVWVVGLAVPVTASYIICAVIAAPALTKLGVPDFAAHMFIFYHAVLSEVSPPTALSPFAAAAITGADPYKTTLQCWKYTVPAFLVPFMFVLDPSGQGLLLMGSAKNLANANWWSIAEVTITAAIGIAALAAGFQGWAWRKTMKVERVLFIVAGFALVYSTTTATMTEPPRRPACIANPVLAGAPTKSIADAAPPPLALITCFAASASRGSNACFAPAAIAASRRDASMSATNGAMPKNDDAM